ncbi:hypothetical protein J6590_061321, partial [Homalodisca vitripennis]
MFADDTTLITKHADQNVLEVDLFIKANNLAQFFAKNGLKLNPEKTKCMTIQTIQKRNSKLTRSFADRPVCIGETELGVTKTAELLGVMLDDGLDW